MRQLREIIPKKSKRIVHFELSLYSNENELGHRSEKYKYQPTFFSDLVEIFPHLHSLKFHAEQLFTDDGYYSCLSSFIDSVKLRFRKLTHLTSGMRSSESSERDGFEHFKHELATLGSVYHYYEEQANTYYDIHFWL